jgi:membrane protein implicated in regulation of membrane protease activity
VIFVLALLLALFVLPSPWSVVAVVIAAVWELVQITATIRWSQRRRAKTGAEALVDATARVVERCNPYGKVAVRGEIWNAHCDEGADVGETVRVRGLQGLTLLVERDHATVSEPASHHKT